MDVDVFVVVVFRAGVFGVGLLLGRVVGGVVVLSYVLFIIGVFVVFVVVRFVDYYKLVVWITSPDIGTPVGNASSILVLLALFPLLLYFLMHLDPFAW